MKEDPTTGCRNPLKCHPSPQEPALSSMVLRIDPKSTLPSLQGNGIIGRGLVMVIRLKAKSDQIPISQLHANTPPPGPVLVPDLFSRCILGETISDSPYSVPLTLMLKTPDIRNLYQTGTQRTKRARSPSLPGLLLDEFQLRRIARPGPVPLLPQQPAVFRHLRSVRQFVFAKTRSSSGEVRRNWYHIFLFKKFASKHRKMRIS